MQRLKWTHLAVLVLVIQPSFSQNVQYRNVRGLMCIEQLLKATPWSRCINNATQSLTFTEERNVNTGAATSVEGSASASVKAALLNLLQADATVRSGISGTTNVNTSSQVSSTITITVPPRQQARLATYKYVEKYSFEFYDPSTRTWKSGTFLKQKAGPYNRIEYKTGC